MRNLVVCCDGTWNTRDQRTKGVPTPTNVSRLYNAVDKDSQVPHVMYYNPGVGTEGSFFDKLLGGVVGEGLRKNIVSAYKWLADTYEEGDRVFLFGFSRGAYTARSLAGFISSIGLLNTQGLAASSAWERVHLAFDGGYRSRGSATPSTTRKRWNAFRRSADARDWEQEKRRYAFHSDVTIHFLGVWDTVGALGVPNELPLIKRLFDHPSTYQFYDTALNPKILHARHAVALDEKRATFTASLWEPNGQRTEKQIWFPGVHGDVGGGYPETGLADGALKWMIDEAAACGLAIDAAMAAQITPNHHDVLHDSASGLYPTQPRHIPCLASSPDIHYSAKQRIATAPIADAPYGTTTILVPGASTTLDIFASQPWNRTGIYLKKDVAYKFSATGEWLDSKIVCTPSGPVPGRFQPATMFYWAADLLGLFNKYLTRRDQNSPWFSLIGCVANGGAATDSGNPLPHETFTIGNGRTYSPKESGYLYCFANDIGFKYKNNRGSVSLTITAP